MLRLALTSLAVLGLLSCAGALPARAASFDCSKATAPDELAICANPGLSDQDQNLAGLYTTALRLSRGKSRQELIDTHRAWLQARAQCGRDVACLQSEYDREAKRLQALLTKAQTAAMVDLFRRTGQCLGCDLSRTDLSGMDPAMHADNGLLGCFVNGTANGTFDGARIDHANFITCGTKYESALSDMSWDGASLKRTDFTGTNLGGNSFRNADLSGANLTGANLYWVDMRNAKLVRANLTRASSEPDAMNGICSYFSKADFSGANLEHASLCGDFSGANFTGARMRNANISASPGNPSTPLSQRINLTEADLRGATIFTETKLTPHGFAFAILCRTVLPDGTTSRRDCK